MSKRQITYHLPIIRTLGCTGKALLNTDPANICPPHPHAQYPQGGGANNVTNPINALSSSLPLSLIEGFMIDFILEAG